MEEDEKLYVSEQFDVDTMAEIAIPINVGGTYQVTGFGIGVNTGMIDSVVYTNEVMIPPSPWISMFACDYHHYVCVWGERMERDSAIDALLSLLFVICMT